MGGGKTLPGGGPFGAGGIMSAMLILGLPLCGLPDGVTVPSGSLIPSSSSDGVEVLRLAWHTQKQYRLQAIKQFLMFRHNRQRATQVLVEQGTSSDSLPFHKTNV